MSRTLKVVIGALAFVGAATIVLVALTIGNQGERCGFHPMMTVVSDNGAMTARVAQRICDKNPKTQTYVLLSESKNPDRQWSVFVANSALPGRDKGEYEPLALRVKWLGDNSLSIEYPRGTEDPRAIPETNADHGVIVNISERNDWRGHEIR